MSAEWQFLVTLNEQHRPLRDPLEIQAVALRLIGEHLRASRVNYAYIDGDEFAISRAYAVGVPAFSGRGPLSRLGNAAVEASRRGETVAVDDVSTDARFTHEERDQLLTRQTAAFVSVPLIKDGQWLALFEIETTSPRRWTAEQLTLIELTATRTWGVGERARAEEALGRTESRQAFLQRLNDAIGPLGDPVSIINETCRLIGSYLRVNRAVYGQIEGEDAVMFEGYVDGVPSLPKRVPWRTLGGSRSEDILKGGTLSINDTSTEGHAPEERPPLQAAGIGAYICPLLVKDGRFVAAFGIHSRLPRVWKPDEIALVQEVADRTWTTLEHCRAQAELRANEERLAFLLRLNDALRPLSDPIAVQQTAATLLGEYLRAGRVGYAELDGREYVIRCEYTNGVPPLAARGPATGFGEALREAYSRGETVVVRDVSSDPRFTEVEREMMAGRQIASFVGVTLIKGGQLVAAFGANNPTPRDWTPVEIALVRDVAERTWDAAERARAEAATREQEHRLRLALDASGGGSWTWNVVTNEAYWDERFRALYGFTSDEPASADAWIACVHEDDRAQSMALRDAVLTSRTTDSWEHTVRIVRPDGTTTWVQSRGRAERDAEGNVTRLSGLDLDFSAERMREEALQARRDEARDRELHLLLETAAQGIVSVDADGRIVSANRALESMFGWAPGELLGETIERLVPVPRRERHVHHRVNYFATPRARFMEGLRLVGQRKDGSTFPVEINLNHVPTATGGRAIAFVTDITERLRAATALEQRTAELESRTTQLRQMAWDLTLAEHHAREQIASTLHDGLQQLLVIVSLDLEQQLKRESESGTPPSKLLSEAKQHLDQAMAAARSLTFELFPPVLQRSGLPAALTWLANWTRDKYRLNVEVSASALADTARKDVRTLLFESARELLFNIVKHADASRATLGLELDADGHICITVTDDGVGFEPSRLDEQWKSGQVGWGLFSIRERLTLLGGRLDIDSAPGGGTRVRLIAPRRSRRSAGRVHVVPVRAPEVSIQDDTRVAPDALRILLVDDHAAVRGAMRRALSDLPQFSVVAEGSNGFEAIEHARALRPDVIVMDVLMPVMDGIDATARIHREFPEIEILGFSMIAKTETVHAIEKAGAAAFFVKGADTQRLIDHLLALHAARSRARPGVSNRGVRL
jgi:PAS domain S-box-containing protein